MPSPSCPIKYSSDVITLLHLHVVPEDEKDGLPGFELAPFVSTSLFNYIATLEVALTGVGKTVMLEV